MESVIEWVGQQNANWTCAIIGFMIFFIIGDAVWKSVTQERLRKIEVELEELKWRVKR